MGIAVVGRASGPAKARIAPTSRPGELLRAYRQAAGLTQDQVASGSGLSVRAIRDLESGATRRPRNR